MKFYTFVFCTSLVIEPLMMNVVVVVDDSRIHYTAITDDLGQYLYRLYLGESNSDPPSTTLDFAVADSSIRLQICEEISRSGVFNAYFKIAVEMDEVHHELQQPQYSHIFQSIYRPIESPMNASHIPAEYENPYQLRKVQVRARPSPPEYPVPRSYYRNEHVFVCLLKRVDSEDVFNGIRNSNSHDNLSDLDFSEILNNLILEDIGGEEVTSEEDFGWRTAVGSYFNSTGETDHAGNVDAGSDRSENSDDDHSVGTQELVEEILRNGEDNVDDEGGVSAGFHRFLDALDGFRDADQEENLWSVTVNGDDPRQGNDSNDIVPFYVSKIYNPRGGLGAHRFVFAKGEQDIIMLAEGSAKTNSRPDFNVELHYLELRKHYQPVTTCDDDPVCKLKNSQELSRLCTIVLTSSVFKDKITYPFEGDDHSWYTKEVSFKTEEALAEAAGKSYFEIMVRCYARVVNEWRIEFFNISRAYRPNEVFVYRNEDPEDTGEYKWYLENLSTNVGIVNERYNFDGVEI